MSPNWLSRERANSSSEYTTSRVRFWNFTASQPAAAAAKIEDGFAKITMTLTSPMCPVAEILPGEVEEKVRTAAGVSGAKIDLVWDPPWDPSMMSEAARLQLGF